MTHKQAIEVKYSESNNTIFIIEGFEIKSVEIELIERKILHFFEMIYGSGKVEVSRILKDFSVRAKDEEWMVTWSWVTSYVA